MSRDKARHRSLWLSPARSKLCDLRFLLIPLSQSMNPASSQERSAFSRAGQLSSACVPLSQVVVNQQASNYADQQTDNNTGYPVNYPNSEAGIIRYDI
jgi:hypothetical protein